MVVRRVPPSLAISVGMHALIAVGWWLLEVAPAPRSEDVLGARVDRVDPEPRTAVEVVMLDAAALAQLTGVPGATSAEPVVVRPAPRRPATRTTSRAARASAREPLAREPVREVSATRDPETHDPSALLDLRKGRDREGRGRDALRISTPTLERIAFAPETPRSVIETSHEHAIVDARPRESIVSAEITPGGRGGYRIEDRVITGRIEADGSVSLKDKRNLQHQFTSWKNIKKVLREAGPLGLLQVDFDITDAMMRWKKMDPYASRKLAFLDQTRDARVELGTAYRTQVLARTSEIVRQNLEVAWAAITDPAARKQALFEMWDEVDESGDEELVAAGNAARAVIIGFIRARIPSGSPGGFTVEEIAKLDGQRKSRITFAPYG